MQMNEKAKEEIIKPSPSSIRRCCDLKKSHLQAKTRTLARDKTDSHFHLQLPVPSILGDKCLSAV